MFNVRKFCETAHEMFGEPPNTIVCVEHPKKWRQLIKQIKELKDTNLIVITASQKDVNGFSLNPFNKEIKSMLKIGGFLADLNECGFNTAWDGFQDYIVFLAVRQGSEPIRIDPSTFADNTYALMLAGLGVQLGFDVPQYLEVDVDGAKAGWDGNEFFGDPQVVKAANRAIDFYEWVEIRGIPIQAGIDLVGRLVALHAFNPGRTLVIEGPQILAPEEDDDGVLADQMSSRN